MKRKHTRRNEKALKRLLSRRITSIQTYLVNMVVKTSAEGGAIFLDYV